MRRVALAALLALPAGPAGAQVIQAGPVELDLSGRVQVQLNTTSVTAEEAGLPVLPGSAFEIRRARFGTAMRFGGWLRGVVEADLAGGGARLADAYVDVPLADALVVRAGQFKKPFSRIDLVSSTQILTIERGVRMRGLQASVGAVAEEQTLLGRAGYVGRDVGAMLHGSAGRFAYGAGLFNGSGANAPEQLESKAVAARGTFRLTPGLEVGGGVSRQPSGLLDPQGDEVVGTVWTVDVGHGAFRSPGLNLMAEAMAGDNTLLLVAGEPEAMWGVQAVAGWFAPRQGRVEGIEPVGRVGVAELEAGGGTGVLLTPGLNLYFTGRNRLMLNGDIYLPPDASAEYALVAQLQVHF